MTQNLPRSFLQAEEDFFNRSFVKSINGNKVRCGELYIDETWDSDIFPFLEQNYVSLVSNILKRVISTDIPFPNYPSGGKAIRFMKGLFHNQFKGCVHPESTTGRMLKNRDICSIVCTIAISTPDPSAFEGAYAVEFHWTAKYYKGNELKTKPIIHCYNSQKDRGVSC